ncbi:MAG: leucine-rich repeat domain-containing protein [Bacteroidales bacterium]|nr:leucine-rich repeat domain-containing protein [Bacteroidales bacterium]
MAKIVGKGHKTWKDGSSMAYSISEDGVLTVSGCLFDGCTIPIKSKVPFHHLVIAEGVQAIGIENFTGFDELEELTLPSSVKEIGNEAFAFCRKLRRVHFSEGLLTIGKEAFRGCVSLGGLHLPETLEIIREGAFIGCDALQKVRIPKSVKSLEDSVFSGCDNLGGVILPKGLTEIRGGTFHGCSALESIKIPSTVRYIGQWAFAGCDKLQDVVIPQGEVRLDRRAFGKEEKCIVKGEDGFDYECSVYNMVTDKAWTTIRPSGKVEDHVRVPAYVECHGKIFPVTTIERSAFSGMRMRSVTLPHTVVEVGDSAFENCSELVSVNLGNSLRKIGDSAFESCKWLSSLELPDTVIQVGYHALEDTRILDLHWGVIYLGHVLYGYRGHLPEHSYIEAREGTTVIADSAFNSKFRDDWKNLEGIVLPDGIKRIGDCAFYMCRNLKSVDLPKSLEYIGNSAFSSTAVREVTLPWRKPKEIDTVPFDKNTLFRVPKGTVEIYSKTRGWDDNLKQYKFVEK